MAQNFTEREKEFLRFQKGRGVDAKTAFSKLTAARNAGKFGVQETTVAASPEGVAVQETKVEEPSSAMEFAKGFGKGALSTVSGISELGQKGLAKLTGVEPVGGEVAKIPEKLTKPEGRAQEFGFGAEQIGEFFIPGGIAGKGAKVASKVKLPASLAKFGKAVVPAAGEAAAVTAAQTGGDIGEIKESGIAGAIGGGIGAGLGKVAKEAGIIGRGKLIPTTPLEAGRDLAKGIDMDKLAKGLGFQPTKEAFVKALEKKRETLGNALESIIDEAAFVKGGTTSVKDLEKGLVDEIVSSPQLREKIGVTKSQANDISGKLSTTIKRELKQFGNKKLDAKDLQAFKRDISSAVKNTFEGALDKQASAEKTALRQLRSRVQKEIENIAPEVKEINKELSAVLTAAKRVAKKPKGTSGLMYDMIAGGAAAGGGALVNPGAFMTNFLIGILGRKAFNSTAVRTSAEKVIEKTGKLLTNPGVIQGIERAVDND
jgi:hypothetical protein